MFYLPYGLLTPQQLKENSQLVFQLPSVNNEVQETMFQHKFRTLETLRKILSNGLANYPRPRKANQRSRLCNIKVPQHDIRSRHSSCGGIGEQRDIRDTCFIQ